VLVGGLIGGATGRFAANLIDSGFQPAQVELLTERLQTGHVALVVEIRGAKHEIERLRGELIPYSAEVVERLLAAGTGA
jgi:uncharacterized membrane protein